MDDVPRVFIVGNSLFAETLGQTLAGSGAVTIIGAASTVETALPLLEEVEHLDAVIVTGADDEFSAAFGPLFAAHPDLSFLCRSLNGLSDPGYRSSNQGPYVRSLGCHFPSTQTRIGCNQHERGPQRLGRTNMHQL